MTRDRQGQARGRRESGELDRTLNTALRRLYGRVLEEPLPPELADLAEELRTRLDAADGTGKEGDPPRRR